LFHNVIWSWSTHNCNFSRYFVWVWNLVAHIEEGT
jgi:hypothetical protein